MTTKTKPGQNLKSVSAVLEGVYRELGAIDVEATELSDRNRTISVMVLMDPVRGGGRQADREREVAKFDREREKKLQALENRASSLIGVSVDLERADDVRRDVGNLLRLLRVRI